MEIKKIAFFGPSGVGKTTTISLVEQIVSETKPDYIVRTLNVGDPLHQIQKFAYRQFDLENTGQDGKLLQFLAGHFEPELGRSYLKRIDGILKEIEFQNRNILILNGDVRNNAYPFLKYSGFVFVRITADIRDIQNRLGKRGDLTKADHAKSVEKFSQINPDFTVENNGTRGELKIKLEKLVPRLFY